MSVDLPAPFSPTMAWISPARTARLTSELATTPGKRLVIPRSSTAFGCSATRPRLARVMRGCWCWNRNGLGATVAPSPLLTRHGERRLSGEALRGVGHLDLALDDLALEVVELIGDVVDEATRGRVADAVDREIEDLDTAGGVAVDEGLDRTEDGDVDLLQHGGEDAGVLRLADGEVLVGVDTDGPHVAGLEGGLEETAARTARGVVDDVRTALVHRRGDLLAASWVV